MSSVFLDSSKSVGSVVLSNNNLTVSLSGINTSTRANVGKISGKWYWEITVITSGSNAICIGIHNINSFSTYLSPNLRYYYAFNGNVLPENTPYGNTYTTGDVIGVALDLDIGTLEFYKNGVSQGISHSNIKSMGEVFPFLMYGSSSSNTQLIANFGASTFKYSIPFKYRSYDGSQNKILLLSNERAYSFENGDINGSLIPPMTSATSPIGKPISSSEYSTVYPKWRAFDGSATNANSWICKTNPTFPEYIGFDFNESTKVIAYGITAITDYQRHPKTWDFQGSNDGSNWDTLHSVVGYMFYQGEKVVFYTTNQKKYKMYRLNVKEMNSIHAYFGVGELIMYDSLSDLIQLPSNSEENLIKYGLDSPVSVDGIFTNKNYILQDEASENEEGLWTTKLNRKPLSISFNTE